jgi:hypothetical protein
MSQSPVTARSAALFLKAIKSASKYASKRFIVNCYGYGGDFPLNTYVTDSPERLLECIQGLVHNEQSGIYRFEVIDSKVGETRVGMNPKDLDE